MLSAGVRELCRASGVKLYMILQMSLSVSQMIFVLAVDVQHD